MSPGGYNVWYGPYKLSQRAINALTKFGMEGPEDLDNHTMTQLRAIPGFGDLACQEVTQFRKYQESQQSNVIDLTVGESEPEPLPQININLQVTKSGYFRRRHYDWIQNMVKNFTDPGTGNPLENESDFIAYIVRLMYANDPSKGGTLGVSTRAGDVDFTPKVSA